jgi:hypothetical protein
MPICSILTTNKLDHAKVAGKAYAWFFHPSPDRNLGYANAFYVPRAYRALSF